MLLLPAAAAAGPRALRAACEAWRVSRLLLVPQVRIGLGLGLGLGLLRLWQWVDAVAMRATS